MTERDDRDLTGAWALDALTEGERAEFEAYLAGDDDARAEAIELSDTAALLGSTAQPVAPPRALRDRVLAAIDRMPQVASDAQVEAARETVSPVADRMPEGRHQVSHRRPVSRARRFSRRAAVLVASSFAVLALVVGGVSFGLVTQNGSTQAISQVRDASDARSERTRVTGGGTATVTWSDTQARSIVAMTGARSTPSDRTYQLWYITGGEARSAGLFSVGSSGDATVALQGHFKKGDVIGVTVEPEGGSTSPTTAPIVAVTTA